MIGPVGSCLDLSVEEQVRLGEVFSSIERNILMQQPNRPPSMPEPTIHNPQQQQSMYGYGGYYQGPSTQPANQPHTVRPEVQSVQSQCSPTMGNFPHLAQIKPAQQQQHQQSSYTAPAIYGSHVVSTGVAQGNYYAGSGNGGENTANFESSHANNVQYTSGKTTAYNQGVSPLPPSTCNPLPSAAGSYNIPTQMRPPLPPPSSLPASRQGSLVGYAQAPGTTSPSYNYESQPRPMPPPQSGPKINPAAMPSIIAEQERDQSNYGGDEHFSMSMINDVIPPLTTTDVPIMDDGNCSSRMMRLTTYHLPSTEDLAYTSKLPLGMVVQPFSRMHYAEQEVPLVDFGENGPIRCGRCRAYLNLFMKFQRGGRVFQCNICGMVNEVPNEYFCQVDHTGRRTDANSRPELIFGTVDYVATKEYWTRTPTKPNLLFAVDCSRSSIQNGTFLTALQGIKAFLGEHRLEPKNYGKMAIVTFDRNIQIFDLRSEPQMLVMSDVLEPFVPLSDGLFFDPILSYDRIMSLLDHLPSLAMETRVVDSCLGAVASFAVEALRNTGGRVVLFGTTLPTVGAGLLKNRDGTINSTTIPLDKVNPMHLPQGDYYAKIGREASSLGISFCLVTAPSAFMDIATIGKPP